MDKCNNGYPRCEMPSGQGRVNRLGVFTFDKIDDVAKQVCEFMYGAQKVSRSHPQPPA